MGLNNIFSDPLYLNNANPFPIFSTQGRYDYLTRFSRDKIKEFIFNGSDIEGVSNDEKIFHANIMPYVQVASTGTNYLGESSVTMYNNKNVAAVAIDSTNVIENSIPQGNPQQAAPNQNATSTLIYSASMPLGAIPEPFNFFALFYVNNPVDPIEPMVYKTGELLQAEYDFFADGSINQADLIDLKKNTPNPSGSSNFNQVSKVVARYLGFSDTPAILSNFGANSSGANDSATALGIALPSDLMYDYSNYKNNYFGLLQYPPSRDPKKLFGYGYFKFNYQKIGIRGTFEWKLNNNFGLKIYSGFSNLDIDQINIMDTTINYQGPSGALMLARYPDPIYQLTTNNSPQAPTPYIQPNIYQLTDYTTPIMDNTSNALFNDNVYNNSELNNYLPDEFKTAFLQNIQYNVDSLGQLINQSYRPYSVQSFDDTTFELFYRRLIVYNKPSSKSLKSEKVIEHMPYTLLPTAAIHVTCPIAPRVQANKVFGKPLDNNGHWELGANLGIEFDFINNIVFGADLGFSYYNQSEYYNVPVPTNQFNEGIYLYNANLIKIPGFSYTVATGMQVDELFKCVDFFIEYRLIRHAEDDFIIKSINNLLPIKYMKDTHTTPKQDGLNTLDTVPNGILFLNENQLAPYPKMAIVSHMREVSSWMVQLMNLTVNYKINPDMALGFAWQQPFMLRNAYNATTLGISFEMYL
jgi:hypothetical protein